MPIVRRLSIRSKIVALVLLTTALVVLAGSSVTLWNDMRTMRRGMIDSAVVVARVTGEQCVAELAFGDQGESAKTLEKLSAVNQINGAFLFDNAGRLFSSYKRDPGMAVPTPEAGVRRFEGDHLHVSEAIVYQGEAYGTIHLIVSAAPLRRQNSEHLLMMVLLMSVLLASAAFLAVRLERVISTPILELAATARTISQKHDYTIRVPKASDDEIGELSDSLNDMIEQISRRERERDEADQRTREKSQFLANMSHELRTPLNAIIGFSEILKTRLADRLSEREQKFVENINTSGQHLLGIVNDILDLSKIEAGRMELHPERFTAELAIESVCNLMRGISARRGISFELKMEQPPPELEADIVKIKQVLYNLLSNAVKFSPDGAVVTIAATTLAAAASPLGEESVAISVTDRGIGIDPANHELIFREFQQVDGTSARQFEGTGLGLSLVRKFMEMHEGSITINSALGKGSTFTINLPVQFRGVATPRFPTPLPLPHARASSRVLVIESDEAAFNAIRTVLHGSEFGPAWARDLEQGLRLAATVKPSAIILDIGLPGAAGWGVLSALHSDPLTREVPVIVVSLTRNQELGIAVGFDQYLTKPVEPLHLLDSLRQLSGGREDRRDILMIDDDPAFHDLVELQLAPQGFHVTHALNGVDGLRMASEAPPSLIVLDLRMEEMDGFEVALRLRLDPKTAAIPVLILTSKDIDESDRERLNGKIAAMVGKHQLTTDDLLSTVRRLIGRQARRDTEHRITRIAGHGRESAR